MVVQPKAGTGHLLGSELRLLLHPPAKLGQVLRVRELPDDHTTGIKALLPLGVHTSCYDCAALVRL